MWALQRLCRPLTGVVGVVAAEYCGRRNPLSQAWMEDATPTVGWVESHTQTQ